MRMDRSGGETARELLARVGEAELSDLLRRLGEERHHRRIARAICRARDDQPITGTAQLAALVEEAIPRRGRDRIHPATRTFMALRIALNDELTALAELLPAVVSALRPGRRVVIISYHSLEDRIVKHFFRAEEKGCSCPPRQPVCTCGRSATLRVITPRPVRPGDEEIATNPRARSARLRCAERIGG